MSKKLVTIILASLLATGVFAAGNLTAGVSGNAQLPIGDTSIRFMSSAFGGGFTAESEILNLKMMNLGLSIHINGEGYVLNTIDYRYYSGLSIQGGLWVNIPLTFLLKGLSVQPEACYGPQFNFGVARLSEGGRMSAYTNQLVSFAGGVRYELGNMPLIFELAPTYAMLMQETKTITTWGGRLSVLYRIPLEKKAAPASAE